MKKLFSKDRLPLVGFSLIMIGFVYLIVKLIVDDVSLNLMTWILWSFIDILLAYVLWTAAKQESVETGKPMKKPWTAIGFMVGATSVTITLLCTGGFKFEFSSNEVLVAVCTTIALLIWWPNRKNGKVGTITFTLAMYIAMIPTFVDQWNSDVVLDHWIWLLSAIGAGLDLYSRPKTIVDSFFLWFATAGNSLATILCLKPMLF